jgi:hypothetical protein
MEEEKEEIMKRKEVGKNQGKRKRKRSKIF